MLLQDALKNHNDPHPSVLHLEEGSSSIQAESDDDKTRPNLKRKKRPDSVNAEYKAALLMLKSCYNNIKHALVLFDAYRPDKVVDRQDDKKEKTSAKKKAAPTMMIDEPASSAPSFGPPSAIKRKRNEKQKEG